MIEYIKLCRVNQWLKNLFIFAPIFFAFQFTNTDAIINAGLAFISFSFLASSIYIINDWKDIEADKIHPVKKNRPLAAGTVSKKEAFILFIGLITGSLLINIIFIKEPPILYLSILYFFMNVAYSLKLKQLSIVDITIVATGFVIRLFIGSFATSIHLSYWIIIITFLLALLLVTGKRRHDVIIYEETKQKIRKSLAGYNLEFLNAMIIIIVCSLFISYLLYTISPEVVTRNGEYLYLTALFVFLGLFRYLQVIFVEKKGDSPTKLLTTDRFLQIDLLLWTISFITIALSSK